MISIRAARASGAVLITAAACNTRLPEPAAVPQPARALGLVPYPPPPARIERVPARPAPHALWIDGQWRFASGRWSWRLGRWVLPPAGARFARAALVRSDSGALLAAPSGWYGASGEPIAAPPPLALADAAEGDVVDADGELVAVGANER